MTFRLSDGVTSKPQSAPVPVIWQTSSQSQAGPQPPSNSVMQWGNSSRIAGGFRRSVVRLLSRGTRGREILTLLLTVALTVSDFTVKMLRFVFWHNQPSLPTLFFYFYFFIPLLMCSLYGPFNRISFHKFSRQLFAFSLSCSSGLISALLVLSTV